MQRYRVAKTISDAIYGQVLLATDSLTDELVAIKKVNLAAAKAHLSIRGGKKHHHVGEDITIEKQTNHHLSALGGHSNVLRMRDDFIENGYDHLVFDYCAGGDLFALVSDGQISVDKVGVLFHQIVSGLAFIHKRGIAHRDLSLENVLIHNDNCYLCDFGLAAPVDSTMNDPVGKLFYMAPEVVRGVFYDPSKADVWSLGIMLFMMLTGVPLWQNACPRDACYAYFKEHGLRQLVTSWSLDLDVDALDLLVHMLERSPSKRFRLNDVLHHPFVKRYNQQTVQSKCQERTHKTKALGLFSQLFRRHRPPTECPP